MGEHGPAILADEPVATDTEDRAYVSFLPIGTILAVMPWNFAFWQVIRAAGPIMLSGNGFVLKHAPNVMGCAYALRDAYETSGFPKHLFAILNAGNDAVTTMIADPRIAAVTVTGSMRAGSAVAATAGKAMKKSLLELGGADAYIVLADADIDKARTLARRIEAGGVFVNGFSASNPRIPVGGVKKSGYGRELSHFGLREFTNAQTVWEKTLR